MQIIRIAAFVSTFAASAMAYVQGVTPYPTNMAASMLARDGSGRLVMANLNTLSVCRFSPSDASTTCVVWPGDRYVDQIRALITAPDGTVWYQSRTSIGKVGADLQQVVVFAQGGSNLTAGHDGTFWFINSDGYLARVPSSGPFNSVSTPMPPYSLARAADGVWAIGLDNQSRKSLMHVHDNGKVDVLQITSGAYLEGVAEAADGSVWFVANTGLGHYVPGSGDRIVVPNFDGLYRGQLSIDSRGRVSFESGFSFGTVFENGEVHITKPITYDPDYRQNASYARVAQMIAAPDGTIWATVFKEFVVPAQTSGLVVASSATSSPGVVVHYEPDVAIAPVTTPPPTAVPALSPLLLAVLAGALAAVALLRR